MRLTTLDDTGTFPTAEFDRQLDIPWDDPYPYYFEMIPAEPPEDDPMRCDVENNVVDTVSQPSDNKAG